MTIYAPKTVDSDGPAIWESSGAADVYFEETPQQGSPDMTAVRIDAQKLARFYKFFRVDSANTSEAP